MNLKEEIISHNLFLHKHAGIQKFVRHFACNSVVCNNDSYFNTSNNEKSWYVVCERTEDISLVQEYLMHELKSVMGKNFDISGGISFFTLDQLGRHFCASLALSDDKNKVLLPKFIFKPYVDISKQENVVDFILNLFHFSTQNNHVLAKQILTLIDIQLPPDLNIFDALIDALHVKKKRSYKDISEIFLKQILASFQASQIVLNRYARLQNFVWDFLYEFVSSQNFTAESNLPFTFPSKFLSSSLLWISAPEYESSFGNSKNYRPSQFSSSLVDDFLECIVKLRPFFSTQESIFIHQRTLLKHESHTKDLEHLSLYHPLNNAEFYKNSLKYTDIQDTSLLVMTGEFDSCLFQTTRPDGGGSYKLLKKDFFDWKQTKEKNFFANELFTQIDIQYDDFLDTASYIENYSKLFEIAKIYCIPIRDFSDAQLEDIFYSKIITENFDYKREARFSKLLKSYSFFPTKTIPQKIIVLWSKAHFEKTSFASRLINQVFSLLHSHGVDIDNPCTDKTFIEFWKHFVSLNHQFPELKIEFLIDSPDSLENFPIDLKKKKITLLKNSPVSLTQEKLELLSVQKILHNPVHEFLLKSLFEQIQINQISTTQFESYIRCPFQFFLENCANLRPEHTNNPFSVEPQILGTKVHKICDLLLSGMVSEFGNDGYIENAIQIYEEVASAISPSDVFLSGEKNMWEHALSFLPSHIKSIFFEAINEIFSMDPAVNPAGSMSSVLFIEMVKRTFLKFLQTEIKNIKLGHKYRVGIVREYPFEITLADIKIRGRIDRIDMNKDGYEIIDYKVSPIPKNTKALCILPSEIKNQKNNSIPSIQGAIYALAFGKKAFDNTDTVERENCLSAFSLYRLKNIKQTDDAMLSYSFHENEKLLSGKEQIQKIENDLIPYAENLLNKKFLPNPILKQQTCQYCAFQNTCPYYLKEKGMV